MSRLLSKLVRAFMVSYFVDRNGDEDVALALIQLAAVCGRRAQAGHKEMLGDYSCSAIV